MDVSLNDDGDEVYLNQISEESILIKPNSAVVKVIQVPRSALPD